MQVSPRGQIRSRSWGLCALLLSLLAWAALGVVLFAFRRAIGAPGDGDYGILAMQPWIVGGLLVLAVAALGTLIAAALGWALRRGRVLAGIAAGLLLAMLVLILLFLGGIPLGAVRLG
ncbi:hypothetical protein [Xanthomonas rydalmerensis]|uniref:Uncharacterized protein n=1 Tax=Xanthomonas rydalmerensis TaxID=3046274 RepID=A0ABZ0JHU2_9XANT|nr:hypothetical protein [Xanthomonas sp. DM-2023]WOS39185.1 hypothetical protein QN243_12100 [Xanthomonas sp. DM-2023]WOS43368.1 hypothetical protein QN242_12100 [Xanthomonas sp. DM-2023]WOS47548.1 hypothetical protein QN240_12100 [Xanthomonas sp. DM-2023]WOS51728.1 hypothetical protein QN244_12100 [Xanthomonas sp. DM-2023]WOS55911.1 hypothetical protein QN245_12100 [Xanthomonas sp. DM-2023]